jgi:hypothetical protein
MSYSYAEDSKDASQKINDVVCVFIYLIELVVGAIAAIVIIFMGLKYLMSGEDSEARIMAKNGIISAFVGIIIIVITVPVVNLIGEGFLGMVDCGYLPDLKTSSQPVTPQTGDLGNSEKEDPGAMTITGGEMSDAASKELSSAAKGKKTDEESEKPPAIVGNVIRKESSITWQIANTGKKDLHDLTVITTISGTDHVVCTGKTEPGTVLYAGGSIPIECFVDLPDETRNSLEEIGKTGNKQILLHAYVNSKEKTRAETEKNFYLAELGVKTERPEICEASGGVCECPEGQTCEPGSEVTDEVCTGCCKKCVQPSNEAKAMEAHLKMGLCSGTLSEVESLDIYVGDVVCFEAEPKGEGLSYSWDIYAPNTVILNGIVQSEPTYNALFSYTSGKYTVKFRVTKDNKVSPEKTVYVNAKPRKNAPRLFDAWTDRNPDYKGKDEIIAEAGKTVHFELVNLLSSFKTHSLQFTGTPEEQPDGKPYNNEDLWENTFDRVFESEGTYEATLTVKDWDAQTFTQKIKITVTKKAPEEKPSTPEEKPSTPEEKPSTPEEKPKIEEPTADKLTAVLEVGTSPDNLAEVDSITIRTGEKVYFSPRKSSPKDKITWYDKDYGALTDMGYGSGSDLPHTISYSYPNPGIFTASLVITANALSPGKDVLKDSIVVTVLRGKGATPKVSLVLGNLKGKDTKTSDGVTYAGLSNNCHPIAAETDFGFSSVQENSLQGGITGWMCLDSENEDNCKKIPGYLRSASKQYTGKECDKCAGKGCYYVICSEPPGTAGCSECRINWGDGSQEPVDLKAKEAEHTYSTKGTMEVTYECADDKGTWISAKKTINILEDTMKLSIKLGDNEGGDDEQTEDGVIFATLSAEDTENKIEKCWINWGDKADFQVSKFFYEGISQSVFLEVDPLKESLAHIYTYCAIGDARGIEYAHSQISGVWRGNLNIKYRCMNSNGLTKEVSDTISMKDCKPSLQVAMSSSYDNKEALILQFSNQDMLFGVKKCKIREFQNVISVMSKEIEPSLDNMPIYGSPGPRWFIYTCCNGINYCTEAGLLATLKPLKSAFDISIKLSEEKGVVRADLSNTDPSGKVVSCNIYCDI